MADFDINSILSSLSQEDIENLKKTAADIMGGMSNNNVSGNASNNGYGNGRNNGNNQAQFTEKTNSENNNISIENILSSFSQSGGNSFGFPDMNMLSSLAPVLQAVNSKDDRVEFINALRPLLSNDRRKKADEAVKIVRLLSVLPLLKERGLM
jgi:hypothetical protein